MKLILAHTKTCRVAAIALSLWLSGGCTPGMSAQADAFFPLVTSLADRLLTADQVALSKWDSGEPVYDPRRQARVLSNVVTMANTIGLPAEDAASIFVDQMEANQEVQYALLNQWRRLGRAPTTPRQSLRDDIRPTLDTLQLAIMKNLQSIAPLRSDADCQTQLAIAVGHVAQQMPLDALRLAALDRAVARICIKQ